MTVAELMAELKNYDPDYEIICDGYWSELVINEPASETVNIVSCRGE
jgi:hypothetical protein